MANLMLLFFAAAILLCVVLGRSILYALALGTILFSLYARRSFSWREVLCMILKGVGEMKVLFLFFTLIGMMTALWRMCGTIPAIICYAAQIIAPKTFVLMTFLLNCGVSLLIGTSFGTATTMGVICMTMGRSLGLSPVLLGGAILSGVFFGDRSSPVSSSAYLVAETTGTDIHNNIRQMFKTALVPFLLSVAIYLLLGFLSPASGEAASVTGVFLRNFHIDLLTMLPAAIILLLACLRVDVKLAMLISIIAAFILCLTVQGTEPTEALRACVLGYAATDGELAALLNGGGIVSMVNVMCIVGMSSSYAEIFRRTDLLAGAKKWLLQLSKNITAYGACLCASVLTAMITCNQSFPTILVSQLCEELLPEKEERAIALENSIIVVAALIPWSIAAVVPLTAVGAPLRAILGACYLYLLPLWTWMEAYRNEDKKKQQA